MNTMIDLGLLLSQVEFDARAISAQAGEYHDSGAPTSAAAMREAAQRLLDTAEEIDPTWARHCERGNFL